MSPEKGPFKGSYIFQPSIFRGHVSFRTGNYSKMDDLNHSNAFFFLNHPIFPKKWEGEFREQGKMGKGADSSLIRSK